ncbi:MerR family transcriptional regulator [Thermosporothrix hazakensis]|nr:MerR family transcriptional regulator [Thermosporothrix hazakensis]BBH86248.1 hypothetical protein KTC_09990 [Thermosporothrix sp. COM3]GCE45330.1 hypothetical protein KTH_01990 [Thermosporothrix hazakensis]
MVAERTGISAHTLRYYERIGLLDSVERASNGHRRYTERDLEWLTFLMCLRSTGMPIRQMKQYMDLKKKGAGTEQERLDLLLLHRKHVLDHMHELENNLHKIEKKIRLYTTLTTDGGGSAIESQVELTEQPMQEISRA